MDEAAWRYDIPRLTRELRAHGTELLYRREVASTMDLATAQGLVPSAVLTDHQTAGRGRYDRQWHDRPGDSILVTFVRPLLKAALPPVGSLLLAHCFVLAVWRALGSERIRIRWPNDLTIGDRKVGGVLLAFGESDESRQAVLFGVGLNVRAPDPSHTSGLSEVLVKPDRGAIVSAIDHELSVILADIPRMNDPTVRAHYAGLWQQASGLLGRQIRMTSDADHILEGTVIESEFGGFLQLSLSDGAIIEVREYGQTASIELVEKQA